jgi:inner membrane protein
VVSLYRHSLHNVTFAAAIAAVAFALAAQKWRVALLALLSFHLHLFEDVLGSRGPDGDQWPIPYLAPFSSSLQLTWRGEWGLNAWENIVITIGLLMITLWLAWSRGFSPLEMVSERADRALVKTLRRRYPRNLKNFPG